MTIRATFDTDLYEFTTSYAYIRSFPYAMGTFSFKNRDETEYSDGLVEELRTEISRLSHAALTGEELKYMVKDCRLLLRIYWEWLSSFRFQPEKVEVRSDKSRRLYTEISDYLYKATLHEVPLLVVISGTKNQSSGNITSMGDILCKLSEKAELSNKHQLLFLKLGTRRCFSFGMQGQVIGHLRRTARYCVGISNCHFAIECGTKPMDTHPREWFTSHEAQFNYKHADYVALKNRASVYDGGPGIVLSDTYTSTIFLGNLSRKQAELFDGVGCDSDDELRFISRLATHHRELGISSITKTIIFSNVLDFGKALDIQEYYRGEIHCLLGIGTSLTSDTGLKSSNIVMKLSQCKVNLNQEWRECVKLSDDIGKRIDSPGEVCACLYDPQLG